MALSVRAYAEFDSGRSSLAHFNRALAAVPSDMGLAVKYAAALRAERRSHDADRVLGQVIGAEPFNIDALHARAQIRWEAALEVIRLPASPMLWRDPAAPLPCGANMRWPNGIAILLRPWRSRGARRSRSATGARSS